MNNDRANIPQKSIDCLFIGHYEMECEQYVRYAETMATGDEGFREFGLNFIYYNNKPYYAYDILNLLGSPSMKKDRVFFDYWGVVMSLTIAYLGTYLHRRGYTFDYVNSFQNQKAALINKLEQGNIHVIAITTTFYISVFPIMELVKWVRKYNHTAKIVVGGPFVANQVRTLDSDEALNGLFEMIGADIYVNNVQGEATLVKIIDALKRKLPLEQVNNLYFKKDNQFVSTPPLQENNQLSENLVDWRLFASEKPEYVNIRTAISCPFKCAFCIFPLRYGKYQALTIEKIQEELDLLNRINSVKTVYFIEDTLNASARKFKNFLQMLIKEKYGFKWVSFLRTHNVDREMVELMKESGCLGVFMGFESGNNQILKNMNKGATVEKNYQCVALLKEFKILTYGSFIIGFPGETEKTAAETRQFIEESEVDFFNNKIWFAYPDALIMKDKEKYGITGLHFDWSHNTMDSRRACQIMEQFFTNIEKSIHVPDINFSFQSTLHLINSGMSVENLKSFLSGFNRGIKERLLNPAQKNISPGVVEVLKKYSTAGWKQCNKNPGRQKEEKQNLNHVKKAAQENFIIDFNLD